MLRMRPRSRKQTWANLQQVRQVPIAKNGIAEVRPGCSRHQVRSRVLAVANGSFLNGERLSVLPVDRGRRKSIDYHSLVSNSTFSSRARGKHLNLPRSRCNIISASTVRSFTNMSRRTHLEDQAMEAHTDLTRQTRQRPVQQGAAQQLPTRGIKTPLVSVGQKKNSLPMEVHAESKIHPSRPHLTLDALRARYPRVPQALFDPQIWETGLQQFGTRLAMDLKPDLRFSTSSREEAQDQAMSSVFKPWTCRISLSIAPVGIETGTGVGTTKSKAKAAAWRHLLDEWVSSGRFDDLYSNPKAVKHESLVLQDIDYWKERVKFPDAHEYPLAPTSMFDPNIVISGFTNFCAMAGLPLRVNADYRSFQGPKTVHHCDLSIDAGSDFTESASADGSSKQGAKTAALYCVVARLHASSKLRQMYSQLERTRNPTAKGKHGDSDATKRADYAMAVLANAPQGPTKVDAATLKSERGAKLEIYDFAARFGLVPKFDAELIDWKRKGATKKLVRVTITLEDGKLSASAVAHNLQSAEVAAAIAFKQEAERQQASSLEDAVTPTVLNSDNAKDLIEYYKTQKGHPSVELESETICISGARQVSARLNIQGIDMTHEAVYMTSHKQAAKLAHLAAAIEIFRLEPDTVRAFRKDGSKLGFANTVDLDVSNETYGVMRDGLLNARGAGLPDERAILHAEKIAEKSPVPRRERPLAERQAKARSLVLLKSHERFMSDPFLAQTRKGRAVLPINMQRPELQRLVSENPYAIVIGATGSGKTTQVPQILLEGAIEAGRGGQCNIICTQPRRIAATSVAARVAAERHEKLGQSVGYHVRHDKKSARVGGSITYCTTGILLEQLKHDADGVLGSTSHIIIDEVHERDLYNDFLMAILRKSSEARRAAGLPMPRVVLMSATLDPDLFARYFATPDSSGQMSPCPCINVPGRTFPVQEQFLGEIMDQLLQDSRKEAEDLLTGRPGSKDLRDWLENEAAFSKSFIDLQTRPVIDWKRQYVGEHDQGKKAKALNEAQEKYIPVALIATLVGKICCEPDNGAILVFLPGIEEIISTDTLLKEMRPFGHDYTDPDKFHICLLHSTVPKDEQAAVFDTMLHGRRKIILATNIAETSVTVSDVTHVIDAGRLREKRYDQSRRISQLQTVWESKSNAKQRAGRAGRVQNGNYYALFSKERHQSMRSVGLPEMLRTDLSETALSVKANFPNESIDTFLAQTIEPPSGVAVEAAITRLKDIEALTAEEDLTDLGRVLSKLPVHPSLGKMIILGVIFRCLDPLLITSAASAERSLFVTPLGRKEEARAKHQIYGNERSDHLATIQVFGELRAAGGEQSSGTAAQHAAKKFLHMGAFRGISQAAQQIERLLVECGLISLDSSSRRLNGQYGPPELNSNSDNNELVKSLLLAGLNPNLAVKSTQTGLGYRTGFEKTVFMDRKSITAMASAPAGQKKQDLNPKNTLFAYSGLHQVAAGLLSIRDVTRVTPLMSVLFGGKLTLGENDRLSQDEWLRFDVKSPGAVMPAKMVLESRKSLDRMLNCAFRSLSKLEPGGRTPFMDDPVRDIVVKTVLAALDGQNGGLSKRGGSLLKDARRLGMAAS